MPEISGRTSAHWDPRNPEIIRRLGLRIFRVDFHVLNYSVPSAPFPLFSTLDCIAGAVRSVAQHAPLSHTRVQRLRREVLSFLRQ